MVWHTFALNPRDYLSDCIRWGKTNLWSNGFPWEAINACVDNESFEFNTPRQSHDYFEESTKLPYDVLKMPATIQLRCPKCNKTASCPWTTCDHPTSWIGSKHGEQGLGFAEKLFAKTCTACGFVLTHDRLRAFKFYQDVLYVRSGIPMQGTILDIDGESM